MTRYDVAIIGAGASGTLTAVQFARIGGPGARGALIEAGARAARGLAYGTPYGAHLLNVPAGRMSALPEDPEHFLRWLRGRIATAEAGTFAPRPLYGDYLASLLAERDTYERVTRVGGTAVGLTRDEDDWIVHLHDDRTVRAQNVVLALGNLPPADPLQLQGEVPLEYVRDPWAPGAAIGLAADAPVLLIGTGLTAIDVAMAIRAEGHTGPIYALSRHGRLPQPHAPSTARPLASVPFATPLEALRWVRSQEEWRSAIDSLRPHTSTIWRNWSDAQRASFLRHLRSLWDVHRHRAAPAVLAELRLQVLRGRIVSMSGALDVIWQPRGSDATRTLQVARAINCTGPASDYARLDLPLVVQLRRAGWLVPDALRLGVETADDGRLLGSDGQPVDGLYTLGPLRRPALWESTAIPEIREQAAALARVLVRNPG
ncbi:MAG TPA: FAD/NAD(P)-binding protein [Thermoanaerobaculia bacterium]|nr:FAD/NAD(P)-binding protein [Thermoanaerobaculia bacterium]